MPLGPKEINKMTNVQDIHGDKEQEGNAPDSKVYNSHSHVFIYLLHHSQGKTQATSFFFIVLPLLNH